MTPKRARELKAEVDSELLDTDADFERLGARRENLRGLADFYERIIQAEGGNLPKSIIVLDESPRAKAAARPNARGKAKAKTRKATRSTSTSTRATTILQGVAPRYLSPRQVLDQLETDGWTTKSDKAINVVRNTLRDLAGRITEIQRRDNGDGSVGYAWHEGGGS